MLDHRLGRQMQPEHSKRCVLVLSTVHQAEDPRIRRRTVGVLARHVRVRYASRPPAPIDDGDHQWVELRAGRLRRALAGMREALRPDVALVSLHDPELIAIGLIVRALRRIPVVLDVHEDVPEQLRTKEWLPRWSRPALACLARGILRLAERSMVLTLAEDAYAHGLAQRHPVLPNYPEAARLPELRSDAGYVVYVGDITEARGAALMVRAVAAMQQRRPLRLVGRCQPDLAVCLRRLAEAEQVELDLTGFLAHPDAMSVAAAASVGLCPLADLPNYRHSLPTKVIEYLAVGIPVIASDLPGTAAVVGGMPGVVLVDPGDAQAFSAALDKTLADTALRDAAQANAPAVRHRFDWPADALWRLYGELLDDTGAMVQVEDSR